MSSTREKFRAVFLAAIMITSICTASIAFSGAAAAANGPGDDIDTVIANANAGDTIELNDGNFDQSFTVDKDNITIKPASGSNPVINATGTSDTAVNITGDNVTLENLEIQTREVGVDIDGNNANLTDNTITGNSQIGVDAEDGSGTSVTGGTIDNFVVGTSGSVSTSGVTYTSVSVENQDPGNTPTVATDNTETYSVGPSSINENVANLTLNSGGNISSVDVNLVDATASDANANVDDIDEITVSLNNTNTTTVSYDSSEVTADFGGNVTDPANLTVTADLSSSATDGNVIDAVLTLNDSQNERTINTNGTQTITDSPADTAQIDGSVQDGNDNLINGVTVQLVELNDDGTTNRTLAETDTRTINNNDGEFRFDFRNSDFSNNGQITPAAGNKFALTVDDSEYNPFPNTQINGTIQEGESYGPFSVNVEEAVQASDLTVTPQSETAVATGEDGITYTANVTGDDGNAFDTTVELEVTDGQNIDVYDNQADTSGSADKTLSSGENISLTQTGNDGEVQVTVASDTVQTAAFTFTEQSQDLTDTTSADFVLDGEGTVEGNVISSDNERDTRAVEGATVHAVISSTVADNEITLNASNQSNNGFSDDTAFYRLVNNETGEVVSYDDYHVKHDAGADLSTSPVRELNTTDDSVGSGFAVTDNSTTGNVTVIPFEPGDYYLQESDNQLNASDDRFVDTSSSTDQFENVTSDGLLLSSTVYDNTVFSVSGNLTAANAQSITDISASDAILIDQTDANGEYLLQNLYADFQNGQAYTLIADAPAHERDLINVTVTEEGVQSPDGDDENFVLNPVDVEPGFVNITNVGLADSPNSEVREFDNQTDAFAQEIPRDGSVDVIDVATRNVDADGELANATVELSVPDDAAVNVDDSARNFTGEFIAVDGGELDEAGETVTITTGEDGQATVFLETDSAQENLDEDVMTEQNETGINAVLTNDASATDFTNKTFTGVTEFTTGDISGVVTDENNDPLPGAEVWVTEIDVDQSDGVVDFNITRLGENETTGIVEYEITQEATGDSVVRNASALENYEFTDFPDVSVSEPVTIRTDNADSTYTLSPVPASDDGVELRIAGYLNDETGTSVPGLVTTGDTGSANVQIDTTVDDGGDSDSSLTGIAAEYDDNGDDQVTASELGNAVTAFGEGDLTASELGDVVTAFGQS